MMVRNGERIAYQQRKDKLEQTGSKMSFMYLFSWAHDF